MRHRQAPGIAQIRPAISRDQLPPVQFPIQPQSQQLSEQPISPEEMAAEIYVRLVVRGGEEDFQTLAQRAREAAAVYFREEPTTNGQA